MTSYKGHKLSDDKTIGGSGRLTKKRIDSFQVYYGKAIRQNAGNIEAASNAVRAILKHGASSPLWLLAKFYHSITQKAVLQLSQQQVAEDFCVCMS